MKGIILVKNALFVRILHLQWHPSLPDEIEKFEDYQKWLENVYEVHKSDHQPGGGGTWVLTVTLCAAPKGRIFSSSKYL